MLKKMEEQQAGKRGEISQQQTEQDGGGAQLKESVVGNAEVDSGVSQVVAGTKGKGILMFGMNIADQQKRLDTQGRKIGHRYNRVFDKTN